MFAFVFLWFFIGLIGIGNNIEKTKVLEILQAFHFKYVLLSGPLRTGGFNDEAA
jgi:hypothetical protein